MKPQEKVIDQVKANRAEYLKVLRDNVGAQVYHTMFRPMFNETGFRLHNGSPIGGCAVGIWYLTKYPEDIKRTTSFAYVFRGGGVAPEDRFARDLGLSIEEVRCLEYVNDRHKWNFTYIADWIEKNNWKLTTRKG